MRKKEPASNIEWKHWGKEDPLFGVAAWPGKGKNDVAPWTDEEFYRLGESDWNTFYSLWLSYGLNLESCLEIGCGAGRLTLQLAKSFQMVTAVDISEGMITRAQQHISSPNVRFLLVDGSSFPLEGRAFSAIFSTHVFQHLDSQEYATRYFAEIWRVLQPDGTLMIHMPVYEWHPRTPKLVHLIFHLSEGLYDLKIRVNRTLIRFGINRTLMRMVYFPFSYVRDTLHNLGFTGVEIRIFLPVGAAVPQPFVMARKPK